MTITGYMAMGKNENGVVQLVGLTDSGLTTDNGLTIWQLAVDSAVSIDPGTITIGAVKVQDAAGATEAKVAASTAVAIANNVLGVHDPQIGQVGDVAADGTVIGLLAIPAVSLGVSGAVFHSTDQHSAAAAVTDAPDTGLQLVITDLAVSVGSNMIVTFSEETSGTVLLRFNMLANTSVVFSPRSKLTLATADKKLMVQTSASGLIDVTAQYYSA